MSRAAETRIWGESRRALPSLALPINPPGSSLGTENAILTGAGRHYYVPDFEGCLSVKTVVSGSAIWETRERRFTVHENSYLILNDRQRYTITIESARKVTTFCLFFQRGFVEDVYRSRVTPNEELLDTGPLPDDSPLGFLEKLETQDSPLLGMVRALRRRIVQGEVSRTALEQEFYEIAAEMVREHQQTGHLVSRLPAVRASTRSELYKRLLRGRDYMLSSLDRPPRLRDLARVACLSPYHFHRAFTQAFGQTPHRYLTKQRLEKARQLLLRRDRSVTEVCLETGFESLGSFSSLFRRHFGASPREFRQAAYFVEILTWRDHDAPDNVPPEVQAIWDQLQSLVERRDGHRGIEFPEVEVVRLEKPGR